MFSGNSHFSSTPLFAMVCANNVNRSTEAHDHLLAANLRVCSFGAGNKVRFPGPNRYDPRTYDFGTSYEQMYKDLKTENEELFTRNGVLSMLQRDIKTKRAPQRWQDTPNKGIAAIDVVICFEERIFDIVVEDIQCRTIDNLSPIHVICLDVKDTPEDAKTGGGQALRLCRMIQESFHMEYSVSQVIEKFEEECGIKLLYSMHHL